MSGAQELIVGKPGRIVVPTGGGVDHPGEAVFAIRGGTELYMVVSEAPIPRNATVLCVESLGPRKLFVMPWTESGDPALDIPSTPRL